MLISPVWNKILKIWDTFFELIKKSTMQQKLFQFFLPQEAGAFGINIEKEPQKPRPQLKNMYIIYLQRIFALPEV